MLRKSVFVTAVILALLGVGCGSSDDSGETQASISKAEFIKRADAICKKTREDLLLDSVKRVEALPEKSQARRQLELQLVSEALVPALEKEIAELRELGAPAGDEAKIERILTLTEPALEEAKTEPETYVVGKDYRFGEEHYGKAYQLALDYGMEECPMR